MGAVKSEEKEGLLFSRAPPCVPDVEAAACEGQGGQTVVAQRMGFLRAEREKSHSSRWENAEQTARRRCRGGGGRYLCAHGSEQ